jgi:large subunit ribosomal protein L10
MNRDQKAAVVAELSDQIRSADAIFAVDYRGISVSDAAALRGRLREAQTSFRIVKNSLTERASDEAGVETLKPLLEGPTALAFIAGDAALAAKALNDAARTLGTLQFKGGLMNGDTLSAEQIQSIARLPAREVLHGQLVGTIAAPLSALVRTLNALIAGIAIQLQQMAEQGLVAGDTPSASEAPRASDTERGAAASGASASDPDVAPPEPAPEEPESASAEAPEPESASAEAPEADAAEAPAETAEEPVEPAPEAQDGPVEPAPEEAAPAPKTSEEPETDASDAEASEA